jgi:hypothetical protein
VGHDERKAPVTLLHGFRKRRLKATFTPIECDQMAMATPLGMKGEWYVCIYRKSVDMKLSRYRR